MNRRSFLRETLLLSAVPSALKMAWAQGVTPEIVTTGGIVRGRTSRSVSSFLGIPYGADTRPRRFQPPRPPEPWLGVREAVSWADRAPQLGGSGMTPHGAGKPQQIAYPDTYRLPLDEGTISEDCLHLNVWCPARPTKSPVPVLLYIHGGAYNSGSVNSVLYDGTRLCHLGNVVVVTVNHRLNAFGFLYLEGITSDPAYADSGNVGMLDLVLALQWVRDNIERFGGDPSCVTIFGQSGGGAKCATLMAMPAAHGLFHRVMTMSGQQVTAAPPGIATARSRAFLAQLGLQETAPAELRPALEAMPLERLEQAARVSAAWLPVVDGRSLPRDPFSPDAPPLSDGIPMILGNTHDETRGLIGEAQPSLFAVTWDALPSALAKNVGSYLGPVSPEKVIADYRRWYPAYSPADVFFAASTAFRSWPGQVIEAERRAQSPAQPRTWVYEMDWCTPVANGLFGAPHTLDIPFFFNNLALAPGMVGTATEQLKAAQILANSMSQALVAFAHHGDPNFDGLPHWPAYDLARRSTMIWKTPPVVQDDPRRAERELASTAHYHQPNT